MKLKGEIILIDDEKYEKEFLEEVLKRLSYEVTVTYFDTAKKGLEYLQKTENDIFLIISDIKMFDMDGLKFKEALNNDPHARLKSIPFVFTTHHATSYYIDEAFKLNIQGFFKKPVELDQLTEMLSIIIKYWIVNLHPNRNETI
jgi:response regulator RpfG family c-di-GMP phosphodiesterase